MDANIVAIAVSTTELCVGCGLEVCRRCSEGARSDLGLGSRTGARSLLRRRAVRFGPTMHRELERSSLS